MHEYNFQGVCLFAYLNTELLGGVIFIAFLAICSVQLHKTDKNNLTQATPNQVCKFCYEVII